MCKQFDLNATVAYLQWREKKLSLYPLSLESCFFTINDPENPSKDEVAQILQSCSTLNMAFYQFTNSAQNDKKCVHKLGKLAGLYRLDNNLCADDDHLTSLHVTAHKGQHDYIPYTNKRLSWHTDGYYNKPNEQIGGILLHCSKPAMQGGESLLMDHEVLYILLRDKNPDWIKALMQSDAMTIPANILDGKEIRPARSGPVFSVNSGGKLHMRYSARLKNIEWAKDNDTQDAVAFIQSIWEQENSDYILRYTLQAGEGVICNNVLHRRTSFEDYNQVEKKRLLYRGRYFDRVTDELNH